MYMQYRYLSSCLQYAKPAVGYAAWMLMELYNQTWEFWPDTVAAID